MNNACLTRNICQNDQPGANLSAEDPDPPMWIGESTGVPLFRNPPLGGSWSTNRCFVVFESTVSQADADIRADAAQIECLVHPPPGSSGPGRTDRNGRVRDIGPSTGWTRPDEGTSPIQPPSGPVPPNGPKLKTFDNIEQACNAACPDGQLFTMTSKAGLYLGYSQGFADSVAFVEACRLAYRTQICFGPLLVDGKVFPDDGYLCQGSFHNLLVRLSANRPLTLSVEGELPKGITQAPAGAEEKVLLGTVDSRSSDLDQQVNAANQACDMLGGIVQIAGGGAGGDSAVLNLFCVTKNPNVWRAQGTVTKPGIYTFKVVADDGMGVIVKHEYTIRVFGLADDTDIAYPDGVVFEDYFWPFSVDGGTAPYTFFISNQPPGLSITPDGQLVGQPSDFGLFTMSVGIQDAEKRHCSQNLPILVHAVPGQIHACIGTLVSMEFKAKLAAPHSWTAQNLPPWASLSLSPDGSVATVKGKPAVAGDAVFSLLLQDGLANTLVYDAEVSTPGSLQDVSKAPTAYITKKFNWSITPTGGMQPGGAYTFSIASGSLPDGLTLSKDGKITGTPTGLNGSALIVRFAVADWTGFKCPLATDTVFIVKEPPFDWDKNVYNPPNIVLSGLFGNDADVQTPDGSHIVIEVNAGITNSPGFFITSANVIGGQQFLVGDPTPAHCEVLITQDVGPTVWNVRVTYTVGGFSSVIYAISSSGVSSGSADFVVFPGIGRWEVYAQATAQAWRDENGNGMPAYMTLKVTLSAFPPP